MTHEQLLQYIEEQIVAHPELKPEILDFYQLCLDEIEEGGSPNHERELCHNSIEELIKETEKL